MTPFHVALLVVGLAVQDPTPRPDCRDWQQCRALALEAAARQDFEAFHDLSWRAVQTGPKNDAALMYLLARAQSLSGRPDDALVMLRRLEQMGVKTDAATNDDFRRVRALPAWRDAGGAAAASTPSNPAPTPAPALPVTASPAGAGTTEPAKAAKESEASPTKAAPSTARAGAAAGPVESLRFTAPPFTPAGLAYDAVSRRFIVGNRDARKLSVVDEFSQHVANLASAQSNGFGPIAALEIDPRLGNLWVVSADQPALQDAVGGAQVAPPVQTTLHKLQLVSGRSLGTYALADGLGPARFADVAATADSTVIVLDTAGHRLFRLSPRSPALELAAALPDQHFTSVAPAGEGIAYVAHDEGILVVDLRSRAATSLKPANGVDLTRIARLRWHKGALIAVQQVSSGSYRAVRIGLGRAGRAAIAVDVLDAALTTRDPTAATVSGGVLYYLATPDGAEMIVKKVTLQ